MANYLTIDGGTTNTRINLVAEGEILDIAKLRIGVKSNINGKDTYKNEIKKGIQTILENNDMSESDIERIICSGMITSELGLCPLEHLKLPCGIYELGRGLYEIVIDEISEIPFVFIRGVKNECGSFEESDIMRGEETELLGITDNPEPGCLYVLPGSHSKLIYIDDEGRIEHFSTELTGEIIEAIATGTILKDVIDLNNTEIDEQFLQKGYMYAKENGVNSAFFKVRILKTMFSCNDVQTYSFFIGAALSAEIENIIKSAPNKVIIAGKKQLKLPISILLNKNSDKETECVGDDVSEFAATYGMVKIYGHVFNKAML